MWAPGESRGDGRGQMTPDLGNHMPATTGLRLELFLRSQRQLELRPGVEFRDGVERDPRPLRRPHASVHGTLARPVREIQQADGAPGSSRQGTVWVPSTKDKTYARRIQKSGCACGYVKNTLCENVQS